MNKNRDGSDKARVRFRYVEFDVEGGNASIQEGLRNIANALTRGAPLAKPAMLPAGEPAPRKNGAPAGPEQLPLSGVAAEAADAEGDGEQVDVTPEDVSAPRQRQPRRYTAPGVVNGLDLSGNPSLEEFAKEKAPDGHNARYLVAAVWLKQQKGMSEFSPKHIFTIYKLLGWGNTPVDVGMPLRELKGQSLVESGEKRGTYKVNDAGVARVARMPIAAPSQS